MMRTESTADDLGTIPTYLADAFTVSARSFLNSLMKEWRGWSILSAGEAGLSPDSAVGDVLVIPLPGAGARALVPITRRSPVGHTAFGPVFYEAGAGAEWREIAFPDLVTRLLAEPSIVGRPERDNGLVFLRRVLDSVATIADGLARPRPGQGGFIAAEQGLRFGHSVHPAPRSRDEFTRLDSRRYGPEHGGGFQLRWWHVAPEIAAHGSARPLSVPEITAGLVADHPLADARLRAEMGRILVPVHPWQAERMLNHPAIAAQMRAGLITDLGPAGAPWFATSSLRTVHAAHAGWMLKFSLSLRLTNSKRIVEPHECERGKEVDRILASGIGAEFRARFLDFRIMGEPAHLSLRDPDGAILPETCVVFRDNPFQGDAQPDAAVLATLCEIDPDGFSSPLARIVAGRAAADGTSVGEAASRWFGLFLDHAVAPCLVAAADYGLLFGAHQQNLVIALTDGWPAGAYFRDCQGRNERT
jgi:N2-citryl-N6-acetyl-N6-hydroxylysine synthase